MIAGHFIVKCSQCGTVITQCRCIGPKDERQDICLKCRDANLKALEAKA